MEYIIAFSIIFAVIVLPILVIGFGIYLLFYKRKGEPTQLDDLKWFQKLGKPAQEVRRREWNKELPRIYSRQWFSQYWHGKGSRNNNFTF